MGLYFRAVKGVSIHPLLPSPPYTEQPRHVQAPRRHARRRRPQARKNVSPSLRPAQDTPLIPSRSAMPAAAAASPAGLDMTVRSVPLTHRPLTQRTHRPFARKSPPAWPPSENPPAPVPLQARPHLPHLPRLRSRQPASHPTSRPVSQRSRNVSPRNKPRSGVSPRRCRRRRRRPRTRTLERPPGRHPRPWTPRPQDPVLETSRRIPC